MGLWPCDRAPPRARALFSLARNPMPIVWPTGCAFLRSPAWCPVLWACGFRANCTPSAPSAADIGVSAVILVTSSHPSLGCLFSFLFLLSSHPPDHLWHAVFCPDFARVRFAFELCRFCRQLGGSDWLCCGCAVDVARLSQLSRYAS